MNTVGIHVRTQLGKSIYSTANPSKIHFQCYKITTIKTVLKVCHTQASNLCSRAGPLGQSITWRYEAKFILLYSFDSLYSTDFFFTFEFFPTKYFEFFQFLARWWFGGFSLSEWFHIMLLCFRYHLSSIFYWPMLYFLCHVTSVGSLSWPKWPPIWTFELFSSFFSICFRRLFFVFRQLFPSPIFSLFDLDHNRNL